MKKFRYIWKYYLRPVFLGITPNSPEGYRLRVEKLEESKEKGGNKWTKE